MLGALKFRSLNVVLSSSTSDVIFTPKKRAVYKFFTDASLGFEFIIKIHFKIS